MAPAGGGDKSEDLSPPVGIVHPLDTCSVRLDTREIAALEVDPYLLPAREHGHWALFPQSPGLRRAGQVLGCTLRLRGELGTAVSLLESRVSFHCSCRQSNLPKALPSLTILKLHPGFPTPLSPIRFSSTGSSA